MTDSDTSPISISLDGFPEDYEQPELIDALMFMINQRRLLEVLVGGVMELLPDTSTWRLTLTGDMVATVNRLNDAADNSYTTERGAGRAGAITLPRDDGTFDIVLSVESLFTAEQGLDSVEALDAHVMAAAKHLGRHEAGHAVLRLRGEDSRVYEKVQGLSKSDAACRKPLSAHVDDNRIEQYTSVHAPSPNSQVNHLENAIAHLRSELNEAKRTWRVDIGEAAYRSLTAANDLVRVLTYLAPELGLDDEGRPNRPDPLPEGWSAYIEDSWDAWSLTFHRLRPVDEPMTTDELGAVLADLCRLVNTWLRAIGIEVSIDDDDREYFFWRKDRY